jgi:hypothetical protein
MVPYPEEEPDLRLLALVPPQSVYHHRRQRAELLVQADPEIRLATGPHAAGDAEAPAGLRPEASAREAQAGRAAQGVRLGQPADAILI